MGIYSATRHNIRILTIASYIGIGVGNVGNGLGLACN